MKLIQESYEPKSSEYPAHFDLGDKVLLYNPVPTKRMPRSFQEFWNDPFSIISKIIPVVYKIEKDKDAEGKQTVHVTRLKKFTTFIALKIFTLWLKNVTLAGGDMLYFVPSLRLLC